MHCHCVRAHHTRYGRDVSIGGHAHAQLLQAGAYAKQPLMERIPKLRIPKVDFIYGESDWMSPRHGLALRDRRAAAAQAAKPYDSVGPQITVRILENAGHNALIDTPIAFVKAFVAAVGCRP